MVVVISFMYLLYSVSCFYKYTFKDMVKKMAKKKSQISTRALILMIVGFLALILFAVISILSKRVELPPSDAVGNTAGNLNNGGLFFEMDGVVYFANVSDSSCLYSMNADETNIKKLSTMHAQYINGYDKYLYF